MDFIASLVNDRIPNTVRRIQECYGFPFVLEDYHPAESRDKNNHQINMIDAAVRVLKIIKGVQLSLLLLNIWEEQRVFKEEHYRLR